MAVHHTGPYAARQPRAGQQSLVAPSLQPDLHGRPRRPAVPVAVCFATGIALDRLLTLAFLPWIAAGVLLVIGWLCQYRRGRRASAAALLLACCVCVGAARHHRHWSTVRPDDVSLFASDEPAPVRLVATLASQPTIRRRESDGLGSAWPQFDKTICTLHCRSIIPGDGRNREGPIPVSGMAQLQVTGHLLHVGVGDRVEILGWMARPGATSNPGQFDFREYLRRQAVHCGVYANFPDAVRLLRRSRGWSIRNWRSSLRERSDRLFVSHIGSERSAVASALLLGDRSHMTNAIRTAFAETGTMHVLAISGLHVGILVGFLWFACRLLNLSPATTSAVIVCGALGYALATNGRPPVVRATLFVLLTVVAQRRYRQTGPANTVALTALLLLMWNPTDLFDVGAQLSFVAVGALLWSDYGNRSFRMFRRRSRAAELSAASGVIGRNARWLAAPLRRSFFMMLSIWVFTAPLVAARFHLVAPVGLLVNVLLCPLVAGVLWLGFAFLFCGFLLPPLAGVFGYGFDGGLALLLGIVDVATRFKLGHLYVPAIPAWWLVGYYLLLVAAVWYRKRGPMHRRVWLAVGLWTAAGLSIGLLPGKTGRLRCTVLAVGHGCSVLVEMPGGRTLLYDAGSISDGLRARQTIEQALWTRGRSRIDAIVVSHADFDHFNAVPGLLRNLPVGCLLVSRPFLNFSQRSVALLCDDARRYGVPLRTVQRGSRLLLEPGVELRVLHPRAGRPFAEDNQNSIVLLIEYAGRRILLTGDVEGPALAALLKRPSCDVDVLLAPHHGSPDANPKALADWARPELVVVSSGRRDHLSTLRTTYGTNARVLSTARCGAVAIEIDAQGAVRLTSDRPDEPVAERH